MPQTLYSREKDPVPLSMRTVELRAVMDESVKLGPHRDSIAGTSRLLLLTITTELSRPTHIT
jgi:hypothetical protein